MEMGIVNTNRALIVANCPGISGTVPDSYLCSGRFLKTCFSSDCPRISAGVATPPR